MKTLTTVALIYMLAGCAAQEVVRPIEVKVPVAVPCTVDMPSKPTSAVDTLPIGSNIWRQMAALRADRINRLAYEKELEAAIAACQ